MHRAAQCPPKPCRPLHSFVVSSFYHRLGPRKDKQKKRIAPDAAHGKRHTNERLHTRIIHPNGVNRPHTIHPNETNHPYAIHPNETVGAAPACPPERPRSGVSIPRTCALCAGDERRMRPCRATRAGTQAPPLPISIIFFHATPHKQNNHLRTIPHKRNQPSHMQSIQTKP